MVRTLPDKIGPEDVKTGIHILDIISSGMYSTPLMILREYIQNATDSLDQAISNNNLTSEEAEIRIDVFGKERKMIISDNGLGVSQENVKRTLCSIAASQKKQHTSRGFRGIGRLGALAYCDELIFETKSLKENLISKIVWDAKLLRKKLENNQYDLSINEIIAECMSITTTSIEEPFPSSYFKVVLNGVKRFHNDDLMHIPTLRNYLSQHAPVPFSDRFSFKSRIEKFLEQISSYNSYKIFLNGKQVVKPHKKQVKLSKERFDTISDIKEFTFYDSTRERELARGWFAITAFQSAIPKNVLMRGIAVRQGNILIGGDNFLAEYFSERRFAVWCIGELHVSPEVKVNARRDGFEHTKEYESLLEQFSLLGAHLSKLCRNASRQRSHNVRSQIFDKQVSLIKNNPIAINKKHKTDLEKIIFKSGCDNPVEIVNSIKLMDEHMNSCDIEKIGSKDLLKRFSELLLAEGRDPIDASRMIMKLCRSLT